MEKKETLQWLFQPKKSWGVMKMVINRYESKLITTHFRQSNKIIENPTEIDNVNIFSLIWGLLLQVKFLIATQILTIISKLVHWTPFSSKLHVNRRMNIQAQYTSTGLDAFRQQHIKIVRQFMKETLSYICNQSFETGFFRMNWNSKCKEDYLFTHYLSVSLLSVFKLWKHPYNKNW